MGAEETKEKLIMLRSITAEQQERGAEALGYKGAAADGTIEGVIDEIGTSPGIENAVVIINSDVPKFLKNYTVLESYEKYEVVCGGAQNQIVASGMIIHKEGGVAPNGVEISKSSVTYSMASISEHETIVPNPPLYNNIDFSRKIKIYKHPSYYYADKFALEHEKSATSYDSYTGYVTFGEEKTKICSLNNYYGFEEYGTFFAWEEIYAPGSTVADETWEFGCAKCAMYIKYRTTNLAGGNARVSVNQNSSDKWYVPFISMAEYNAAVALTAVPQTMAAAESVEV